MKRTKPFVLILAMLTLACTAVQAQTKRAITFDDLISMQRVSDPQISPTGKWVVYNLAVPDREANRSARNLWLVAASGAEAPV